MARDNPGIVVAVRGYNGALVGCLSGQAHTSLVGLGPADESWYLDDGYHFSATGACRVQAAVERSLTRVVVSGSDDG